MRFGHPELWWLYFIPLLALALFIFAAMRRRRITERLGDPELIATLMASLSYEKRMFKALIMLIALVTLALAAMRPQFGRRSEVQQQSGIDIAVAFDISKSMLARDVHPSRINAAKTQLNQLITMLTGHRVALIPFAGIAFTQSPLTADKSAFRLYLKSLDPQQMPVGGTNLSMAIREGVKRLVGRGDRGDKASRSRVLLLMTDGEDLSPAAGDDVKAAAQEAKEAGVLIYAVAVGTRSGEPIPILNADGTHAGYQKDRAGRPIYSKLNLDLLRELAVLADPENPKAEKVFHIDGDRDVTIQLAEAFNSLQKSRLEGSVRHHYGEKYPYALIPALLLLLLELLISDRKREKPQTERNDS